ncbi:MAG: ABC transporter ATP-binding protein [Xanthomonadaceae bacterium]|nr:ABC transporter ATP-binding protein [Xanthomonadaceae bacterium]
MSVLLETRGLHKRFGAVVAAKDISVAIERDSVVGLIGTNGAGKTTFVNMVTGYLKPDQGSVRFKGRDVTPLHPRQITRLGVGRSFQIPQLYDSLSAYDNVVVALGIALRNARPRWLARGPRLVPGYGLPLEEAAEQVLERFGLAEFRDRPAGVLPGGVRKLLDIAMTLALKPELLLLDEPTSGVSSEEKFAIMDRIMRAVRGSGATVLFVEHDMDIVSRYASRVLAFYDGRVIADGAPAEVLADPDVQLYVTGTRTTAEGAGHADD